MQTVKVTLREKKLQNGRRSLYLDFYPPIISPKTSRPSRREVLRLYLYVRPRNETERQENKETKALAESIRSQRQLEIQAGTYGFAAQAHRRKDFLAYFKGLAEKRKDAPSNYSNWLTTYTYLERFTDGHCLFGEIDETFCADFQTFLLNGPSLRSESKKLSPNAALSYYTKFRAAVNEAFAEKLLADNPAQRVKSIKAAETQREFLTLEELQALAATECDPPELKRVALFMALTGLRWSDASKLTWREVQHSETEGYYLRFIQKKTGGAETLPISDQAAQQLGTRGTPDARIFNEVKYSAWTNLKLTQWASQAGVSKRVTFHVFRHTFATLQLTLGTDIYTVSKMLGHKDLKTTQIYAKVIDQKKREAANKIKLEL